ncbi:HAD family hydrolase [Alicyclobacillus fastidiosus]|uniref:HAD family hydrolase n=1 Tax=Alicyclobacillus fastidiosus TaxID=392011 RepID=A0ABY6ZFE3_9BACL|nr:HAD family hydrolase [Alicyclobacillus fastidiosus]WAH41566.1 HAD family hydrolase [Alicyclobacillus fastidiosus]GMA63225.1 hydrolase [Alicyclobacillus fastidiosus]
MLTTLLFDLDGTLLPFELDSFMRGYFERLVPHLRDHVHPHEVAPWILGAMRRVVENEVVHLTNLDKFRRALFDNESEKEAQIWPIFEAFYASSFQELQDLTSPTNIAREICRTAYDKGYQLVLATNPIFPEVATQSRMRWAGLDESWFRLVTTMENSHFCKPNPKYFLEILDALDLAPNECMMIGNDVQEDGAAGHVGIRTYLVTDNLIDRELGTFHFEHQGTLEEVLRFVKGLPPVRS